MSNDLLVLLPVILPLTGAAVAVLLRRIRQVQFGWSLAIMAVSLACSVALLATAWRDGQPLVYASGGWPRPFAIDLVGDLLAGVFLVISQLVVVLGLIYARGSTDRVTDYPAFCPLLLALATGLSGAVLTGDLFNFYVFAELLLISGTVLVASGDHDRGTEAAYKYFYISLLASFFLLMAVGSLYVSYGTLNMAALAMAVQADPNQPLLWAGIGFMMAALMVKSAVFPFHFWQPDLYSTAPTAVGAVLAAVVSKLGIYGFLRMDTLLFVDQGPQIRSILLVLGTVGVIFGGLAAIGTSDLKRMLAYSSLAQLGFILVAVGWGTGPAIVAALVFTVNHALIKAAMIMLAGYVASRTANRSAAFGAVTGAGKGLPAAGFLFFTGSLALAGIPPTNGFISKWLLFASGIDAGGYWALLLIGIASIFTVIYTIRAFYRIWWQPAQSASSAKTGPRGDRLLAPAMLLVLAVALGVWAQPLVHLAQDTSAWLGDPAAYIAAVLGG